MVVIFFQTRGAFPSRTARLGRWGVTAPPRGSGLITPCGGANHVRWGRWPATTGYNAINIGIDVDHVVSAAAGRGATHQHFFLVLFCLHCQVVTSKWSRSITSTRPPTNIFEKTFAPMLPPAHMCLWEGLFSVTVLVTFLKKQ